VEGSGVARGGVRAGDGRGQESRRHEKGARVGRRAWQASDACADGRVRVVSVGEQGDEHHGRRKGRG
jgi:hypothetical protein